MLKSLGPAKKQFLAGYLCASLHYLIKDTCSRQILLADGEASSAIIVALLAAASNTDILVGQVCRSVLHVLHRLLQLRLSCVSRLNVPPLS